MSHGAELDENNIVVRVLVGDNNDPNGDEGYQWLIDNLGGRWVKTSYNNSIRKRYAGTGFLYDEQRDVFIAPKIYDKQIWNEEECAWVHPIPIDPNWDENLQMIVNPMRLQSKKLPEHISTKIEVLP